MDPPGPSVVVYDAVALPADAGTVEALARLQLAARRRGVTLRVRHASAQLRDLLTFLGLLEVLGVEVAGQAEEREEAVRVEEERQLRDPSA